ncbi:MAG: hypothetical protein EA382_10855 [Spirochaetaceae bacterium]|nr:MAG: hypothetical protein EA382_10855 [Spirochaetaceae bacterium]
MGTNAYTDIDSLIDENIDLLRCGLQLIDALPGELYREGHDRATDGGVGRHFRHIIEFYERLADPDVTTVDYGSRRRDSRVESDAVYAATSVTRIIGTLEALRGATPDSELTVVTEILDAEGRAIRTRSSTGRELAVLASHTIHHYAIIALLLRGSGVKPPEHFGIAPSTLRYAASRPS